ncbi:hypothetical protein IM40_08270 [Candidatus Paracaedimonas acanthamoebae]|nr:hypothetical protein IM40_08270 [Candidatus Paracaedimonas acanthamoebae]
MDIDEPYKASRFQAGTRSNEGLLPQERNNSDSIPYKKYALIGGVVAAGAAIFVHELYQNVLNIPECPSQVSSSFLRSTMEHMEDVDENACLTLSRVPVSASSTPVPYSMPEQLLGYCFDVTCNATKEMLGSGPFNLTDAYNYVSGSYSTATCTYAFENDDQVTECILKASPSGMDSFIFKIGRMISSYFDY